MQRLTFTVDDKSCIRTSGSEMIVMTTRDDSSHGLADSTEKMSGNAMTAV